LWISPFFFSHTIGQWILPTPANGNFDLWLPVLYTNLTPCFFHPLPAVNPVTQREVLSYVEFPPLPPFFPIFTPTTPFPAFSGFIAHVQIAHYLSVSPPAGTNLSPSCLFPLSFPCLLCYQPFNPQSNLSIKRNSMGIPLFFRSVDHLPCFFRSVSPWFV